MAPTFFKGNRYQNLTVGLLFMLGLSSYSAWGVIQPHAMAYFHVDSVTASVPFYIFSIFFTVGSIISGWLQKRYAISRILRIGCACSITGLLLTALFPPDFFLGCCFSYGILMGCGGGISYNAVLSNMQNWFYQQIGKITGILLCMVGLSGFLLTALCNMLLSKFTFTNAFALLSIYYFVVYLPGLLWMRQAPAPPQEMNRSVDNGAENLTPKEMLHTPHYYLIMFAFLFAVPAYTLISPIFILVGQERGLSYTLAVAGSMTVSISQTAGRLFFPALSDRLRHNGALLLDYVLCAVAVLIATFARGNLLFACFIIIGFAYGGFMGTFPAVSTKYFGLRNAGANYGFVMIGNSLSGIVSPVLSSCLHAVSAKFAAAAISCGIGILCILSVNYLLQRGHTPISYVARSHSHNTDL